MGVDGQMVRQQFIKIDCIPLNRDGQQRFFLCRQPKPGDKHAILDGKFSK